ncbi:hypothetical protein IT570_07710 [Candidatus Sumerlaeota bacterium]|nr:hypothetical protein [Candidatus Sumerlaeota bacterium]
MTAKKLMWLNFGIFLVMLCVSVYTLMRRPQYPGEPDVAGARAEVIELVNSQGQESGPDETTLHNLGKKNVFSTIIALPTPTPAPTKTPDPGPTIDEVLLNWKLVMPTKTFVIFQEIRTQKDANVKMNETFDAEYKGKNYKIKLIGVDTKKFTATVEMENLIGEKQTKVYSMM